MKLTWNQEKVLLLLQQEKDPFSGCHGMSEHGGRASVLKSLCRRGLLQAWVSPPFKLTEEGKKVAKQLRGV